jgi:hypothetical protein
VVIVVTCVLQATYHLPLATEKLGCELDQAFAQPSPTLPSDVLLDISLVYHGHPRPHHPHAATPNQLVTLTIWDLDMYIGIYYGLGISRLQTFNSLRTNCFVPRPPPTSPSTRNTCGLKGALLERGIPLHAAAVAAAMLVVR